ncbi:PREDICTED: E3 ubiquitin-protein ligase Topors-like [Branchiostoma belcheri]|uniref:E3 ubiquitin-protein ligase Topors n=1 Tax=Branchiostoma belcheri TaxID=7741 RepID=A0A6P5ATG7_BRABE|nr:PREDICTED: E3 ubiquitin-protein ligase Topors-like [Branchiostoma belcheri]
MATVQNQSPYIISSDSETEESGIKKCGKAAQRSPIVCTRSLSSSSESSDEGSRRVQKPAPPSPDRNCSICLQQFNNKAFADNCFHSFCYACIKEWSKVKATCPLCKTDFQSIIHTVKSIDDYQQDYLLPLGNGTFGTIDGERFRYRTTLNLGRRMMAESRVRIDEQMAIFHSYARHERIHCSRRYRPERRMSTISIRKRVYSRGLRARGVQGDEGRSRDISAQFYRRNPAVTHRLVPWLSRELEALVASRDIVDFLLQLIITVIQQVDLGSSTIKHTLEPYLLHRTDHFLHEFITFAKYPFDMAAFDRNVIYESPIFGNVSPISSPRTPNFDRLTPPDFHNVGPTPHVPSASSVANANIPTAYLNWAPRHSTWDSPSVTPRTQPGRSVTSTSGWDDETPGPSGLNPDQEPTVPAPSVTVKIEVREQQCVRTEHSPPHSPANSSSSGESVVFTGYIKPLAERTPDAFISLSSGSEDEAPQEKNSTLEENLKSSTRSKASSRRYRSRSRNRRSRSRRRSREGRYKDLSRRSRSRSRTRRSRSSSRGRGHFRSRDRSKGRGRRSRSRSRRRSRGRSRSSSRNREKERLLNKPGGKRKQKTRHLEGSPASGYRGSHRESTTSSHSTHQPASARSKDIGHERRSHRSRSRERSWRSTSKDRSYRSKVKERPHRSRSKDRSPFSRERDHHEYRGHARRSRSVERPQLKYQQSPHSRGGSPVRYSGTYKNQGRTRHRSRSSSLEVTYDGKKKQDQYDYHKYSYSHRKHDEDSEVEVTFCKMSSKESRSKHHHHKSKKKHKHKKKSKKHKKSKDKEKNTEKHSSTDEESSVGDVECLSTVSASEKGDATEETVAVVVDQTQDREDCNNTQDSQNDQHSKENKSTDCEFRHEDEASCSSAGNAEETCLNRTEEDFPENNITTGNLDSQTDSTQAASARLDNFESANVPVSRKVGPSADSFLRKDGDKSGVSQSERRVIRRSPEQEVMSQEGIMGQEVTSQEGQLEQDVDETVVSTSHRRIVLAPKCQDERRIVISRNGGEGS